MSDLVVYVLVRNDLPSLNPGKMAAQVHHAGVQMMSKHSTHQLVINYIMDGAKQGADGFNTTLVLSADAEEIADASYQVSNLPAGEAISCIVKDPSYPFVVDWEIANLLKENFRIKWVKNLENHKVLMTREEDTCAWFLGSRDNPNFKDIFAQFSLHP